MSTAELRWTAEPADPTAVVLVLHGGREHSIAPVSWSQLPVLRMIPFARAVARVGEGRIAVARLKYAIRGWNEEAASPVPDARAALEQIRVRHPGVPIALLGHSMGGRVALSLAADPDVTAVVGLAPWVEPDDVARGGPGLQALLVHGTDDRMTDPRNTARMAGLLRDRGVEVTHVPVAGSKHAMLQHAGVWHRTAAEFLRDALLSARHFPA